MSPVARRSLVLSLLFACNDRPVEPAAAQVEPVPEVAATTKATEPVAAPVRAAPKVMPPALAEPPAPTAPVPAGTPTVEGRINALLALDEQRAVVQFYVPGPDHSKQWWLAQMRRDGSIAWITTLAGDVAQSEGSAVLVRAGETVSVATQEIVGNEPVVTLHGFSLADGASRFTTKFGPGFLGNTVVDGALRFDTTVRYLQTDTGGVEAELIATSEKGVAWRAKIGAPIPVGHDPTVIADVIAVRTEDRQSREIRWQLFERGDGKPRGELVAEPQSCSDGQRWFVRGKEGLLEVDPATASTRLVMPPPTLSGGAGPWVLEDCTIADGKPIVLVARGARKALVALDPRTLAIAGHVELGAASVGFNGFDPLPAPAPRGLVMRARVGEDEELLAVDAAGSRVIGRWRGRSEFGGVPVVTPWRGGVVFATEHTIAVITGDTGELAGRAVLAEATVDDGQVAGDTLWLAPTEPLQLGRRAPRLLALAGSVADDVRDAVLTDLGPVVADPTARPKCPDPRNVVRGDGLGAGPQGGPVARTRLPAWDLEILYETARQLACAPGGAPTRLMAWFVMEDDRPLRNDNALLLVEDTSVTPPRFSLVEVYRHATNHEWNTIGSFHDRREPLRTFDHRPTRAEVDAFIEQSGWTFGDSWGRVLAGNVVDDEWRAATGEAPWRAFAPGVERPD